MPKTALLIVDVQRALIEANPYNKEIFLDKLKKLLSLARKNLIEPIYVQHSENSGTGLEYGTRGWEIAEEIAPETGDIVIHKQKNSAFKGTNLHGLLQEKGVATLILVGMQTEYCIDATCKSAFDLDYSVIIPSGCTTTFDNAYFSGEKLSQYYEEKIWHNRFAQVLSIEQVLLSIDK